MANIIAIATGTTALNLGLAGILVEEIADIKDAEKRCLEVIEDKPDVLILEESIRNAFSDRIQDRLSQHRGTPLIINCPAFDDEGTDVDAYLSAIIKPAVGFEIRLG